MYRNSDPIKLFYQDVIELRVWDELISPFIYLLKILSPTLSRMSFSLSRTVSKCEAATWVLYSRTVIVIYSYYPLQYLS